ncbi:TMAO reductase system periplasmic protein TorT [Shewanella baltica]|uniref:TMAO reductase system periplasmic protein TorT n=1 Tax=Shewanella baltica TaxID=62322 RepID=UPI00217E68CD|nr:TMAO reductase system periplasmic protein TorT [Shewanella baltica]MCS6177393.1 TMAO reductase system periplasmic protein TorT [Shewanella baltica]MCS6253602.1 TMAO reductase system periplasmic protein TorT [Shewanella baltica]
MMRKYWQRLFTLATFGLVFSGYATSETLTWPLELRSPFNVKIQQSQTLNYLPLTKAQKPWRICALVPHLKDAYWIGIDYGLIQHAKALGVSLDLFEAGSYYHKDKQLAQLQSCMQGDYDAILLGSVSPDLLAQFTTQLTKPVLALVNKLNSDRVQTHIGVNWYQMGLLAGNFIKADAASQHPHQTANLALLAGPENVGGTDLVEQGIRQALEGSQVKISAIQHADNNRNLYRDQLQILLKAQQPDYILGSAVAIEAAISTLKQKGLSNRVKLVSSYLSPAILRGLKREKVIYSNDDLVVLQGKLAIDVTVKQLEGAKAFGDIGPAIIKRTSSSNTLSQLDFSLAEADFYPLYQVRPNSINRPL